MAPQVARRGAVHMHAGKAGAAADEGDDEEEEYDEVEVEVEEEVEETTLVEKEVVFNRPVQGLVQSVQVAVPAMWEKPVVRNGAMAAGAVLGATLLYAVYQVVQKYRCVRVPPPSHRNAEELVRAAVAARRTDGWRARPMGFQSVTEVDWRSLRGRRLWSAGGLGGACRRSAASLSATELYAALRTLRRCVAAAGAECPRRSESARWGRTCGWCWRWMNTSPTTSACPTWRRSGASRRQRNQPTKGRDGHGRGAEATWGGPTRRPGRMTVWWASDVVQVEGVGGPTHIRQLL
jgi:hypothetical protein